MKLGTWIENNIPKVAGIVALVVVTIIVSTVACPNEPPKTDEPTATEADAPDKQPAVNKPEI